MSTYFSNDKKSIPPIYDVKICEQTGFLMGGKIHEWSGPTESVYSTVSIENPESGRYLGKYPLMNSEHSLKVLEAAEKAWDHGRGKWPTMNVDERINCVKNFAKDMVKNKNQIRNMLMWEIAKSAPDAEKEFNRTVEYISLTIDALKDLDRNSSRLIHEQSIFAQVRRAPLGITLCMGPYNYPLNETFTTLIPSLITGNIIIFKPPKKGVLLHKPLLQLFARHFPEGTVNTIYGDGREVVTPLMKSGKIDVLAFIGSSKVADILKSLHPDPHRLRSVLGLEAKNAAIIMDDANLQNAVNECISGSLSYNGQRCTALKIIFVHRNIFDNFMELFISGVEKLKKGLPWEDDVKITPMPDPADAQRITEIISDAVDKGAQIANPSGGKSQGTLLFPTVVTNINSSMRIAYEEQFGPVVPVLPFTEISEPVKYIIDSPYGQQASIFGKNPEKIGKLIDPLVNQVCRLNINSQCQRGPDTLPFTGRKDSAEGTLSITDALRVFTIRTLVAAKDSSENSELLKSILHEHYSSFLNTDYIF
ncbi:MAG: NADP-dependent glyceraldehyde-3-phosphate dehydrogenase [Deltaproteobacteria bacterium]|nr:NADP-dependent glyceraldehyde-3-phosphate dehydrogenase [Deltaproteobacteria bacterium]